MPQSDRTEGLFLRSVAEACMRHYGDLSDFCFVFPNRRSGTFFLKELAQLAGRKTQIAPEVLPMGDFMSRIAGMDVAPRITQIMELYQVYRDVRNLRPDLNTDEELMDFDRFVPFGEIVLSDFSEIDMYDVDTKALFSNISDYNSIAANYLTDEQRRILEEIFNFHVPGDPDQGMWRNQESPEADDMRRKFLELWRVFPELYDGVRRRLSAMEYPQGTAGSVYRRALDKVRAQGLAALPWKHVVTVGLDGLSVSERELFRSLADERDDSGAPGADFFWDMTGPVFSASPGLGWMVRENMKVDAFPMPVWAEATMKQAARSAMPPRLEEIGVPSNVMQVKVAGQWVEDIIAADGPEALEQARVAVVLPDEDMLLPLLHSLPYDTEQKRGLKSVNLTMGWSMRYTATAAFMHHLQRVYRRRIVEKDGTVQYLAADLRLLLGQPMVQMLAGVGPVQEINTMLDKTHRRVVSAETIAGMSPELGKILKRPADQNVEEAAAWLDKLLGDIDNRLAEGANRDDSPELLPVNPSIERMQLMTYRTALNQIRDAAVRSQVDMHADTLFHVLTRSVSGEKISFEGRPLQGLQVMGMLETRALDFDRIIVLSMNDTVMPRKVRKRSFILDSFRREYRLPSFSYDEDRYAYWFYRLLSRARQVTLVYDSRVGEGMRSGGKSRFLMQLEKLYARDSIAMKRRVFPLTASPEVREPVAKSPRIMEMLRKFTLLPDEGGLNLSASALNAYLQCGLKFYYLHVLRYRDDPEPSDVMDNITRGLVFHDVMQHLYFEKDSRVFIPAGKVLSAEDLQRMRDDDDLLRRQVRRAVKRKFLDDDDIDDSKPLRQSLQDSADYIVRQVRAVLDHDSKSAPLVLYGAEIKEKCRWKVSDTLEVNMTASFDRVDESGGLLRVVDYKTGGVHLAFSSLDDLWAGKYESSNVLQLLLYANLLEDRAKREGIDVAKYGRGIGMSIFKVLDMESGNGVCQPVWSPGGYGKRETIETHKDEKVEEFRNELNSRVLEPLFDSEVPFAPTDDPERCRRCVLAQICGR